MAIQVLGLRDKADQPGKKREVFFSSNWRFARFQDVFDAEILKDVLSKIPAAEQFNLYFTVADCHEEKGRKLKEQWAIPFDIDDIYIRSEKTIAEDAFRAAEAAISVLGVPHASCPIVFSGHGVQFFVLLDAPILSDDFFHKMRDHYGAVCEKMQAKLDSLGIVGRIDSSVFSGARLMRLPSTDNRKPNKPNRTAFVINGGASPHPLDLREISGLTETENDAVLLDVALKNYPKPDTKAVLGGCDFLKWCKSNPNDVKDPQWYRMLSITARLDEGHDLSHEYSEGHNSYSHYETEHKIEQALKRAGPALCKTINHHWGGCSKCPNFEKIVSPILIRGPDYIASADTGYRIAKRDDEGKIVLGKPMYIDLIRKFRLDQPYKVMAETEQVVTFDGLKWAIMLDPYIKEWVRNIVKPEPNVQEMNEFIGQLKSTNVTANDWFIQSTHQKLNFKNCVLDTSTGEVFTHKPEYGFFNVLPFDYDKYAKAPTWEKFISEICDKDAGTMEMLEEFGGYCISGDSCWLEKAMLIIGEGANGKSTFMETLGNVVGANNKSSVPFKELEGGTKRYLLVNKLFNYSEETGARALFETENFKNLVSGGTMSVKQLYLQEYEVKNRTKFILAANEMPHSGDKTHGFMRKLILVKLYKQFNLGAAGHDPYIREKLNKELAGICNRLIEAYNRLKARGHLSPRYDNEKHVQEYMMESNNVARFVRDVVTVGFDEKCSAGDLYQEYVGYCEVNGEKSYSAIHFSRLLGKQVIFETGIAKDSSQRSVRIYKGISFVGSRNF